MGPEQISVVTPTKNPWGRAEWNNIYNGWPLRSLQREYRRLSSHLAAQFIDATDIKCMGYLLTVWKEETTDENITNHVMMLKDSKLRWIERQILYPYMLQNEVF